MSQKRHSEDAPAPSSEGSTGQEDKRRKIPAFKKVVMDAVTMHQLQRLLEPLIRRVVKEEVELALKKHLNTMKQSCMNETPSSTRSLKLRFVSNPSLPVFTGARIEGEELPSIQIALVDCSTGQIVISGPESLAKIEVVVLEGDFDADEADNWTAEEFKNNVVREREGKKPLITGEPILNLKEGVGLVGEISFTDNSSWTRSRRFRLGARVLDNFDGIQIREAKTEPFIVRDHRGELYKKHHPPVLTDEVWRLEKIGKDGAFHKRLSQEHVYTVKDFLTLLFIDPPRLRNILGPGMSAKMWEITAEHARKCVLEKRTFLYCPPDSQPKTGVVFNVVGEVMGLLSDSHYVSTDKLSETEKVEAHNILLLAFENWADVVPVDNEASLTGCSPHFTNVPYSPRNSPNTEISSGSKFLAPYSIASPPDIMSSIYAPGQTSVMDDFALHNMDAMELRYDHGHNFPAQALNSLICDSGPIISRTLSEEGHLQFLNDADLHSDNFSLGSSAELQNVMDTFMISSSTPSKALRRWKKLASVLKWFFIMMNKRSQLLVHGA